MKNVLVLVAALAACNTPTNNTATPSPAPGNIPSGPAVGMIQDPGEKVLSVNGTPVGAKELELVFQRMRVPSDQIAEFAWTPNGRHVAEEYALVTALYNDAVQQQIWTDPEIQRQLAFTERQVLAAAMREKMAKAMVTDQAVEDWYARNKARFDKPEVKARHIRVSDEALAKDLLARIQKGEKFEDLAKIHSADQASSQRGGDVGWFQEQENRAFGKEAFAAEKGALLGPIKSTEGYHIVEVLDKRPNTPLEEVRPLAEIEITRAESPKVLEAYRKNLKIEWVKEPAAAAEHPGAEGVPGATPGGASPHGPGGAPLVPPAPPAPGGGAGR